MSGKKRITVSSFKSAVAKYWEIVETPEDISSLSYVICRCLKCGKKSRKKAVKFTEDSGSGKSGCRSCYEASRKTRTAPKDTFRCQREFNIPYLDEGFLDTWLRIFCTKTYRRNRAVPELQGKRSPRPDFLFPKEKLIIEFDGPLHYTDPLTIIRDIANDETYRSLGYSVVRIPYFIQLQFELFRVDFSKIGIPVFSSYPHGFVHPKVVLPATFCSMGIEKFKADLKRFGLVRNEIMATLKMKVVDGADPRSVVPLSMLDELAATDEPSAGFVEYYYHKQAKARDKSLVMPSLDKSVSVHERVRPLIEKFLVDRLFTTVSDHRALSYVAYKYFGGKRSFEEAAPFLLRAASFLAAEKGLVSPESPPYFSTIMRLADLLGDEEEAVILYYSVAVSFERIQILKDIQDKIDPDVRGAMDMIPGFLESFKLDGVDVLDFEKHIEPWDGILNNSWAISDGDWFWVVAMKPACSVLRSIQFLHPRDFHSVDYEDEEGNRKFSNLYRDTLPEEVEEFFRECPEEEARWTSIYCFRVGTPPLTP
jgi:hypothetical protein